MKGVIIYKGKYGATRKYAEWISAELQLAAVQLDHKDARMVAGFDYVILGSSVYIGTLQLKSWLRQHESELLNKKIYLFIVCGTPASETQKLDSYVQASVPAAILKQCRIYFLPGRLIYNQLSWMDKFMLRMGALLSKEAKVKKAMLTDYDNVKKENLAPLLRDIKEYSVAKEDSVLV